jgi:serine/threonine protein kinase
VAVKKVMISGQKEYDALTAEVAFGVQISRHVNVVKCHGGYFNDDRTEGTMVLEYLPTKLNDMANASDADKARLSLQVAEGIAFLHRNNCTHRDIKPENVMIGEDTFAKLIDFGLAKSNGIPDNEVEMSEDMSAQSASRATGVNRGTLAFMAPELLAENSAGGNRSVDTYAYGVLLFEFWTGQHAFPGNHNDFQFASRLKHDVCTRKVRPVFPYPHTLPYRIDALIQRCWAHEPEMRPTMDEAAAVLQKVVKNGTPVVAEASGAGVEVPPRCGTY